MTPPSGGYLSRPAASSLAEVVNTILDKGVVVDVYARASLLGIELLTVDARVAIASVDSYLRFAEAVSRLDLYRTQTSPEDLVEDTTEAVAQGAVKGVIGAAADAVEDLLTPDDD